MIDLLGGRTEPLFFCVTAAEDFPRDTVVVDVVVVDDEEGGDGVCATRTFAVFDAFAASILSSLSSRSKAATQMESTVEEV